MLVTQTHIHRRIYTKQMSHLTQCFPSNSSEFVVIESVECTRLLHRIKVFCLVWSFRGNFCFGSQNKKIIRMKSHSCGAINKTDIYMQEFCCSYWEILRAISSPHSTSEKKPGQKSKFQRNRMNLILNMILICYTPWRRTLLNLCMSAVIHSMRITLVWMSKIVLQI